ncbi:amino acid permease [Streptomyces tanashiensis]
MWMDGGISRTTVNCLPLIAAALTGGWFLVRRRVRATSAAQQA